MDAPLLRGAIEGMPRLRQRSARVKALRPGAWQTTIEARAFPQKALHARRRICCAWRDFGAGVLGGGDLAGAHGGFNAAVFKRKPPAFWAGGF
jgi:hypothetical protein